MSNLSFVFRTLKDVMSIILNNKTISEIDKDVLLSNPEISKSYEKAVESLRNGEETATVKIDEHSTFEIKSAVIEL